MIFRSEPLPGAVEASVMTGKAEDRRARMIRQGRMIFTELGEERQCACCKEFWPNDSEFFCHGSYCKACQTEKRENSRAKIKATRGIRNEG